MIARGQLPQPIVINKRLHVFVTAEVQEALDRLDTRSSKGPVSSSVRTL
jgi:predicted DNA-binding transcriptional regulator AlpA